MSIVRTKLFMVEATGLEPAASWSQTKHSTKLSYASSSTFVIISHQIHFVNTFFHLFLFFLPDAQNRQHFPHKQAVCSSLPLTSTLKLFIIKQYEGFLFISVRQHFIRLSESRFSLLFNK